MDGPSDTIAMTYTRMGKQILCNGEPFADCVSEEDAMLVLAYVQTPVTDEFLDRLNDIVMGPPIRSNP